MKYATVNNNQTIPVADIPEISYDEFLALNTEWVKQNELRHCVNYFGYHHHNNIKLICCIADDITHQTYISSSVVNPLLPLDCFTTHAPCFEKYEREIHENFGISYPTHPWLKPVRYAHNRADKTQTIANYPFYKIDSEELHEVGVGPIHAGIIEPGHFRFICNGEQILHLEIQLGYQHRGIESQMLTPLTVLQRSTLAEAISGDSAIGHTSAFANLWESLCNFKAPHNINYSRTIALEMERLAMHSGDLGAICGDVAYQLGSSVLGRLRTPMVNYMQEWGGNRLGKGFIRPGVDNFPLTPHLIERLQTTFKHYEPDFNEITEEMFSLPSTLSRFERTGVVSHEDAVSIGAVGMAARTCNLNRDIRASHPFGLYKSMNHEPILKHHGDVYSRAQLRREEVGQSIKYIRNWIKELPKQEKAPQLNSPQCNAFTISMVEGWRGEICHCAITDDQGELIIYKIKDPSFHNWLALALAVRNNEISDFPVCNKSFNLSYSGHDL